jgi:hypothetical protein
MWVGGWRATNNIPIFSFQIIFLKVMKNNPVFFHRFLNTFVLVWWPCKVIFSKIWRGAWQSFAALKFDMSDLYIYISHKTREEDSIYALSIHVTLN